MEESEKRRERLRAMRNEAFEAQGSTNIQSPTGTSALVNPLVETPVVQGSHTTPRFDYYTDPMAAYSGNKRQNNFSQSSRDNPMSRGGGAGRGNPPMMQLPPPPPLEPGNPRMTSQPNYHPDQGMQQGPGNPQMMSQPNYYPDQGMQQNWRPPYYGSGPIRTPMAVFNPHPDHQHHGFPNRPVNPSGHFLPRNASGGLPMPRPGPWVNSGMNTNVGRGGTHYYPNPGRGRSTGQWTNNNPSPGGSGLGYGRGGRGFGYRGHDATSSGNLYRKSMVEDPWKELKPVVWRAVLSSELFRKLSPDAKKPRVEEACSVPRVEKESLADYLAAAFDEAAEGGDDTL